MNIIKLIIYKISEIVMYSVAYLINEIHLNYFIYSLTFIATFILTILITCFLKCFGICDNYKNDKNILNKLKCKFKNKDKIKDIDKIININEIKDNDESKNIDKIKID